MIQFISCKCMILMLKGNFEFYQKPRNPLGPFITLKTRTPGLCLTRFWDVETCIVARRNSITCAILSIPTESRFTNALERSLWTFTNSIIIATVTGNVGIFFDVWITEWQWIKIQVKDISSFPRMALSLFYLWVFPAYSRKEREGDSREKGFYRYYKKIQHCELIHFWWYRKLKSGIWGLLPRIIRISDTLPFLVSPDMLSHRAINLFSKYISKPSMTSFNRLATFDCCWGALREQITIVRNFIC